MEFMLHPARPMTRLMALEGTVTFLDRSELWMTDKVTDDRSLDWLFFTPEPEPKFELEFSRLVTGPRRKTSFHPSSLLTCRLGLVTEVVTAISVTSAGCLLFLRVSNSGPLRCCWTGAETTTFVGFSVVMINASREMFSFLRLLLLFEFCTESSELVVTKGCGDDFLTSDSRNLFPFGNFDNILGVGGILGRRFLLLLRFGGLLLFRFFVVIHRRWFHEIGHFTCIAHCVLSIVGILFIIVIVPIFLQNCKMKLNKGSLNRID